MPLVDAIAEAVAYADSPPPNEAATCLWVIYPLLQAMGYAPPEIHPQGSDNNGQYPDYTLMPSHSDCWYLEAKAWNINLQDSHVYQALNYANHNGKRWVVLTNGRSWRLYDNHVLGIPTGKLVVEVQLADGLAAQELLTALGRTAYLAGQLDAFARHARLVRFLRSQMFDEDSVAVKALWNVIKKEAGLANLSRSELIGGIHTLTGVPATTTVKTPNGSKTQKQTHQTDATEEIGVPLDRLGGNGKSMVTGNKPVRIILPDGSSRDTPNWRLLSVEVVRWLGEHEKLPPVPFRGGHGGKRFFLNSTPHHQHGPMSAHATLVFGGQPVYLDIHRSGIDLVAHSCDICKSVGVDPATFRVVLPG